MRARRLSVLLASVALTGCTQTVHGTAVARFTLPVDDFPSTAGYTAVDSDSFYIRDGNPEYGFVFIAPNGLVCGMNLSDVGVGRVECTGSRPDRGPGTWTVDAERSVRPTSRRRCCPAAAIGEHYPISLCHNGITSSMGRHVVFGDQGLSRGMSRRRARFHLDRGQDDTVLASEVG